MGEYLNNADVVSAMMVLIAVCFGALGFVFGWLCNNLIADKVMTEIEEALDEWRAECESDTK